MKRFKNILFVYDGEKESGVALKRAVDLAKTNEATLTVVEVLEEFPPEMQRAIESSKIVDFQKIVEQESSKDLKNYTRWKNGNSGEEQGPLGKALHGDHQGSPEKQSRPGYDKPPEKARTQRNVVRKQDHASVAQMLMSGVGYNTEPA